MKKQLLFLVTMLSLGCTTSYAQENGNPIFLMGKVGNNVGIENCPGTCSANTSGTIGIGISGDFLESPDPSTHLNMWNSIGVEYKREQFNINGNQLNVQMKAINLTMGYIFPEASRYIFTLGLGWGWQTTSVANMPDRTRLTPYGDFDLLYKVNPNLYLSVGYTHEFIFSGYPDFIANGMDVGLRWYP
ncbi:MAG: hypothetical protein EPO42_10315 [Gallionellaceae bacterium]|nr:MAG: hypothetical protein EPO42_10315 [Gallionellaceae bacterium]